MMGVTLEICGQIVELSTPKAEIGLDVKSADVDLEVKNADVDLEAVAAEVDLEVIAGEVQLKTYVPGPPGPPGPSGGTGFELPTQIHIGGNRAVATENGLAVYADNTIPGRIAIGVSMAAAVPNFNVSLQSGGVMLVTGAGWVPDEPVFFGADGVLTQTPPDSGFIQKVGVAHGTDKLLIEIIQPITL